MLMLVSHEMRFKQLSPSERFIFQLSVSGMGTEYGGEGRCEGKQELQAGNPCNRTEEIHGCLNVGGAVGIAEGRCQRWSTW